MGLTGFVLACNGSLWRIVTGWTDGCWPVSTAGRAAEAGKPRISCGIPSLNQSEGVVWSTDRHLNKAQICVSTSISISV